MNIRAKKIFILAALLTLNLSVNAQSTPPDPDSPGGSDPGVLAIGDYVPLLVIVAIGLAFYSLKKFQVKKATTKV